MHDYVAARLIRARHEDSQRAARAALRRERSPKASATAYALRVGLLRPLAVVGVGRVAPHQS